MVWIVVKIIVKIVVNIVVIKIYAAGFLILWYDVKILSSFLEKY